MLNDLSWAYKERFYFWWWTWAIQYSIFYILHVIQFNSFFIRLLRAIRLQWVDQFVLLFPLHSPVLEPNLDLPFCQAQCMSNLNATPSSEILVKMKLFLQLKSLVARVSLTAPSPRVTEGPCPWKKLKEIG